jgi:hypothetical protein
MNKNKNTIMRKPAAEFKGGGMICFSRCHAAPEPI